jgi:hypothetical protein
MSKPHNGLGIWPYRNAPYVTDQPPQRVRFDRDRFNLYGACHCSRWPSSWAHQFSIDTNFSRSSVIRRHASANRLGSSSSISCSGKRREIGPFGVSGPKDAVGDERRQQIAGAAFPEAGDRATDLFGLF